MDFALRSLPHRGLIVSLAFDVHFCFQEEHRLLIQPAIHYFGFFKVGTPLSRKGRN